MNLNQFVKESRDFLKDFYALSLPNTKSERYFFLFISLLYLSFSPFFVFNTFLLDHPESCCDIFYGFDSQYVSRRGFANITAHPFMFLFSGSRAVFEVHA